MTYLCAAMASMLLAQSALPPGSGVHCDPQEANLCAAPLLKAQPAPFAGTLMTDDLAIRLGQKASECDPQKQLRLEYKVEAMDIDLTACHAQVTDGNEALTQISAMAQDAAERCQKELKACEPPFWEKPWFVGTVSAILGGAVVGFVTTR